MHGGVMDTWLVKELYDVIVFEIARQQLLDEKKTDILVKVNDTLFHMKEKDALNNTHQIACWMDHIKDYGGMRWSGMFHYVDIPYIVGDIKIVFHPQSNATGALVFFHRDVNA